jgi:hypothetical protein
MKKSIKQKQKQKQKQTTIVNINLAKARARAKSSAKKSGGRSSVMMLPPPIYASPIDRLTPAMYGAQGQQIQQKSMEEVLRNFLTNQEKQTAPVSTPNTLGSAPRSAPRSALSSLSSYGSTNATANSSTSSNSLTDYGSSNSSSLNSLRYFPNQHSDSSLSSTSQTPIQEEYKYDLNDDDNVSELTDNISLNDTLSGSIGAQWEKFNRMQTIKEIYKDALEQKIKESKFLEGGKSIRVPYIGIAQPFPFQNEPLEPIIMPTPFQNEQRTYLKASKPDYDINEPKSFSQNEARMSQGNIYESSRRPSSQASSERSRQPSSINFSINSAEEEVY